jgi:phytoene dehydrogenase-like protein
MGSTKYDSVIIGAGLSGLAAGIRLAQFGKEVLVVEKHSIIGGLNSFYSRFGRKNFRKIFVICDCVTRQ